MTADQAETARLAEVARELDALGWKTPRPSEDKGRLCLRWFWIYCGVQTLAVVTTAGASGYEIYEQRILGSDRSGRSGYWPTAADAARRMADILPDGNHR